MQKPALIYTSNEIGVGDGGEAAECLHRTSVHLCLREQEPVCVCVQGEG